jgi:FMNH2-dependent dimethyl sulfone monooxygenase
MVAVHPGIVTPQAVAKMGASLDRISGGRLAVNIVNGWWPDEMNLFGNGAWIDDADMRAARMGEFIEVLSGLWTQERFSFDGKYYRIDSGSLPIKPRRQPSPRIYAASRAPSGKELVAKMCDVWFAEYKPDYRLYEENLAKVGEDIDDMRERARRFGRTLEYGLSAHVICADTMEGALAQAHELEAYGKRDRIALIAAKAIGAGFVGTPELIAERVLQYEKMGVGCLMLRFHPMLDGLKNFAEKVVPLLGHRMNRPSEKSGAQASAMPTTATIGH